MVVAHGNGPQVGMINIAMTTLSREDHSHPIAPMSVCTAMSQGYIGYDLQNSLREELLNRGIQKPVATVLTQVEVDPADPAFQNPSKPIGTFMTEEEAEEMRRRGNCVMEDAGRGWRRCVASPKRRGRRVHRPGPVRPRLHAAQGPGCREVRRVQARPHGPHHPAGEGQGRHRRKNRHRRLHVRSKKGQSVNFLQGERKKRSPCLSFSSYYCAHCQRSTYLDRYFFGLSA